MKLVFSGLLLAVVIFLYLTTIEASQTAFYDAQGKRIGYAKKVAGKTRYYDGGGKFLGYSKESLSGLTRYYDHTGKFIGSSRGREKRSS